MTRPNALGGGRFFEDQDLRGRAHYWPLDKKRTTRKPIRGFFRALTSAPGQPDSLQKLVSVLSATNRDLRAEVKRRTFRDFYYRQAVFRVRVPPLREMLEDVPPIAERFPKAAG